MGFRSRIWIFFDAFYIHSTLQNQYFQRKNWPKINIFPRGTEFSHASQQFSHANKNFPTLCLTFSEPNCCDFQATFLHFSFEKVDFRWISGNVRQPIGTGTSFTDEGEVPIGPDTRGQNVKMKNLLGEKMIQNEQIFLAEYAICLRCEVNWFVSKNVCITRWKKCIFGDFVPLLGIVGFGLWVWKSHGKIMGFYFAESVGTLFNIADDHLNGCSSAPT